MSPRETRRGQGPATGPEDVLEVVHILAGRAQRAGQLTGDGVALGRRLGYVQSMAELLGTEVAVVERGFTDPLNPFGLTTTQPPSKVGPDDRTDKTLTTQANDWTAHPLRPQTEARADVQTMRNRTICQCGGRMGWARLDNQWDDDLWVCPGCGGPSQMVEEKTMGLAYFRGGPLDGNAYEVAQLGKDPAFAPYITQYNWTAEIIESQQTGAKARVWVHKDEPAPPNPVQEQQAMPAPPAPPASSETGTVPAQEGAVDMSESSTAPAPAEPAAAVTTDHLRAGRERLKASRTDVSKLSGLTIPQIARMEKGGPRTKSDEVSKYEGALAQLEQQAGAARETPAPPSEASAESGDGSEPGDTKGPQAPAPIGALAAMEKGADDFTDTGGVVRLHRWREFAFVPRGEGDMASGTPCRVTSIPGVSFTFIAFTRNEKGVETIEVWETRRRRVRYVRPEAVQSKRRSRARVAV